MQNVVPEEDVDLFLGFVKSNKGIDLSLYRKTFLARRMKSRFDAVEVKDLIGYLKILKENPAEWNQFLDKLNINVSEFFRDPDVFKLFKEVCLPDLIDRRIREKDKTIRCWSCGCSCGEEPYSLAILFSEVLGTALDDFSLKIYATDNDEDALNKARKGEYIRKSVINAERINKHILDRYFKVGSDGVYRVVDRIKKMITFQKHNLMTDKLLKRMDAVFFRNVRIYFSKEKAENIILGVHEILQPKGYLVLGKVETISLQVRELFETISFGNKIFKKLNNGK